MGKIRHMARDRLRPIYRYPYANSFVYLVCSVAATCTSIAAFLFTRGLAGGDVASFWIVEIVLGSAGIAGGYLVARHLFFVTANARRVAAATWSLVAATSFPGLCLLLMGAEAREIELGTWLLAIPIAILVLDLARCRWISLYTDGVIIGKLVIKYADFVYTEFATGKPYTDHLPEQAKGKRIEVLTPIDYEYIERDFGVSHYYCFIITKDAVYVAQSLTGRSDFAANVRNAWSCYDWNRRQKNMATGT
ncbi:MAG: hypothetical protein GYA24_20375 [Candidatus Lokiarchaeota archaeon]|nr:hypothetical protein [Candidatus Lokiarchaeota archaeon]